MEFDDFCAYFTRLEKCSLSPMPFAATARGAWRGRTACGNAYQPLFKYSPQVRGMKKDDKRYAGDRGPGREDGAFFLSEPLHLNS